MALDPVTAVMAQLRTVVKNAVTASLRAVPSCDLLAELATLGAIRNQLHAMEAQVLAEVESRRLDGDYGATKTTAELLSHVQPMTHVQATQRVELACDLSPGRTLTGEPLPALTPLTAEGCAAGVVSRDQAVVVVGAVRAVRAKADVATAQIVEKTLVEACPFEHARGLRRLADQLITAVDQDGPAPSDAEKHEARRGWQWRKRSNGMWRATVDVTGPDYAAVQSVLDPLSAPAPAPEVDGDPCGGDRDPRSASQRRYDAMIEVFARVQRSGTLPSSGGAPVTVLVTVTESQLRARRGVAVTDRGEPWPVRDLLAAAHGEWAVLPALTTDGGAVLNLGREQRLASTAQRRALTARDGGCCFPGCDRPVSYTQAHHILDWSAGGTTDIDNLCLLCTTHHRTFGPSGWQVRMGTDRLPEWLPPPWLDPHQRPRRNTSHRKPELTFPAQAPAVGIADSPG